MEMSDKAILGEIMKNLTIDDVLEVIDGAITVFEQDSHPAHGLKNCRDKLMLMKEDAPLGLYDALVKTSCVPLPDNVPQLHYSTHLDRQRVLIRSAARSHGMFMGLFTTLTGE